MLIHSRIIFSNKGMCLCITGLFLEYKPLRLSPLKAWGSLVHEMLVNSCRKATQMTGHTGGLNIKFNVLVSLTSNRSPNWTLWFQISRERIINPSFLLFAEDWNHCEYFKLWWDLSDYVIEALSSFRRTKWKIPRNVYLSPVPRFPFSSTFPNTKQLDVTLDWERGTEGTLANIWNIFYPKK